MYKNNREIEVLQPMQKYIPCMYLQVCFSAFIPAHGSMAACIPVGIVEGDLFNKHKAGKMEDSLREGREVVAAGDPSPMGNGPAAELDKGRHH